MFEISLRIPSLRVRREGKDSPETISNSDVRFIKRLELERVPKAGDVLTMTIGAEATFQCEVVGSNWHDDKNMRHGVPVSGSVRFQKRNTPAQRARLADEGPWRPDARCSGEPNSLVVHAIAADQS
jgi:hypothetical protein